MPDVTFISTAPIALDGGEGNTRTSRIEVAMLGAFKDPRYGAFSITPEMVDAWKARLSDHFHGRVPIDRDHATDKGASSEAMGWITSLDIVGDRVVANVEWTPAGVELVGQQRYRYISPTFVDNLTDIKGNKLGPALLRAALTNNPALSDLAAVSLSGPLLAERVELADAPPAEHTGKDAPDLQIVDDVVSKRKCPHCDHEMDADTPDDAVMCAACRKKYLDAPVSIMVGDRVAESLKDLSLGKHGTCVHTWALAEGGAGVEGMIVHDVTWDDGTRSLGVQGFYLRCLTPWRSLEAVPVGLSYLVALARS